jgi:chemotaxis protein MotB
VHFLIDQGIAPNRLSATGFGEFHPIDPARTPEAFRRNRRIELKLTAR